MTKKDLISVAKKEIAEWHLVPHGLVIAILFAFIHRVTRLRDEEPEAFERAVQFEKSYQDSMGQIKRISGKPFLHRSCIPISEVNFNGTEKHPDMFGNECEGMCGV